MNATKHRRSSRPPVAPILTLGDHAYAMIREQYHRVIKQEKKVLADHNPEHLHRMRVSTRRLRTALQVFDRAIELPKAAAAKRIGSLARTLGTLRDLDVQMADLQNHYRPAINATEQQALDAVIAHLGKHRRAAFSAVEDALTRSRYRDLKAAYENWLALPRLTPLAAQPIAPLIPDLLSPLLSTLLLHPGWLIQLKDVDADSDVLHDLRKACKHVRYQAEFFLPFHSDAFKDWIEDVKTIQARLGTMHDSQVLLELLAELLPKHTVLPELQAAIAQTQADALADWESVRQRYLDPVFRSHLHHLLLEPLETVGILDNVQAQPLN